jgi:hypothetical protein
MSEDYLARQPMAMWNTVRGVWEKPEMVNLLCEHLEPFSETWPSAGTMRSGMVWRRQRQEPRTEDSGFSSLPTPLAQDSAGAMKPEDRAKSGQGYGPALRDIPFMLRTPAASDGEHSGPNQRDSSGHPSLTLQLLRTPAASEAERGHQPEDKARARGGQVTLSGQFMNLPTPTVADTFTDKLKSSQQKAGSMHSVNLSQAVHMMPTPNTMDDLPARDESKIDRSKGGFSNVRETVVRPNFDRFEPAIRRWEAVTENPAPAPTKPDGKDGAQRLSSEFTEWMMGLRPGWVTGHGLSRKDELKACGNGVVPQQAMLALKILKARFTVQ